jgi:hypothetical protein
MAFVTASSPVFLAPVLPLCVESVITSYHGSHNREGDKCRAPDKTKDLVYPYSEPTIGVDVCFNLGQKTRGRVRFSMENGTR